MVKAWQETVVIPTYEVGTPEKNPIFLEKRVYQGSSGVVYPYPVIESIADEKCDKEYRAVYLENEYIKVMILPELGGRIQMAYDKIKKRHFIYYNHVIKPALVGLAGPWISGGIEFNWPQHHRPSTYLPVDCKIEQNKDGSITVWVNEMERMFHQKGMAGFTLRPGCAFLEIQGKVSNRTSLPQTFLWWANPAVEVNDYYQSVFPPDVNAVFDHGKRAVSSFPIATGTYYKMDYSAGVDISNYKNIKVPTSYMAVNSKYDFEGGYENDTQEGMLHVASHHFSPGKKQWTWGNGDFGRAWDRCLTDDDYEGTPGVFRPYIELMAGVYTENQPDFTWLMPYEEKQFVQYFMPYRDLGIVKQATKDFVMNMYENGRLQLYATSLKEVELVVVAKEKGEIYAMELTLSPEKIFDEVIDLKGYTINDIIVYLFRTDDASRMKQANEMNALYKKYNVNPFSMILITFLQFPIIIAMYQAVQRSAVLKSSTFLGLNLNSTPLEGIRNGQFLYILIFEVMGICQFASMYLPQYLAKKREEAEAEKHHRKPKDTQQSKQQKYMQYYFMGMIL
ncbi:MAG: DUF5107 domain-containing protein, partial [Bacteroidaceae bacterium]|nr:DUF5107 domain-containing protein [Bacteroidaceae bacterium]